MTKQKEVCPVVCVSENRKQCICQMKKLAIQLQGEYTQLTCSNKLSNAKSIIYKHFTLLLDLFTISSEHSGLLYSLEMQLSQ